MHMLVCHRESFFLRHEVYTCVHFFRQIESSNVEITQQVEKQQDLTIINIAGTFTLLSCIVTMFHMTAHLRKMNQPFVQRKIMAILWMVREEECVGHVALNTDFTIVVVVVVVVVVSLQSMGSPPSLAWYSPTVPNRIWVY